MITTTGFTNYSCNDDDYYDGDGLGVGAGNGCRGYGYGYGYGTYGGGAGYGYYGSEKKQSRNILQLVYNLVVVPFLAFFGRRK